MKLQGILNNVANCKADMDVVDFLLNNIQDWQNHLVERHHKFVYSYLHYKKNLKMTAIAYNFSESDMSSIFWRIQRKLMVEFINRVNRGEIKVLEVPKKFNMFLYWELMQSIDNVDEVYYRLLDKMKIKYEIDKVSDEKRERIKEILDQLIKVPDLQNKLPNNIYLMVKDLFDGVKLSEVAKKHGKSFNYLVENIIGRKKPRRPSEAGWLNYLNENNNKICQFDFKKSK